MGQRICNGDYAGGMSVTNARKDSTLALETARDLGVPLFATSAAHTPYEIAEQLGYGELDYAALAKLWESWCDVRFS
jgi:3-hydroxyisobutyrate dehydrogenase-like beta-hydroxyacid dehydrogenase